jgi:hypothetical protein
MRIMVPLQTVSFSLKQEQHNGSSKVEDTTTVLEGNGVARKETVPRSSARCV